jgi:hypothetical protein
MCFVVRIWMKNLQKKGYYPLGGHIATYINHCGSLGVFFQSGFG